MAPLDMQPASLGDDLADDPFVRFRSSHPSEVMALLRELRDGGTPVALSAPGGCGLSATVWTVDDQRQHMAFEVETGDPQLPALVEANEVTAVAYLDAVKLQFELHNLVLVHSPRATALQAVLPRQVYRFQRRSSYRVRTLERGSPLASLRHPSMPDMQLALRIVDISISGCALLLPDNVPPLAPGCALNGVELELDTDTRLTVTLRIQHASSNMSPRSGLKLGCLIERIDNSTERVLQRYIDHTQKRRRLLSLD